MLCRSEERGFKARDEIIKETGNQNVFVHVVDMSSPRSIHAFVSEFAEKTAFQVLVNNAGCMLHERKKTAEGFEENFATNSFGVFYLTTLLIPYLEKQNDPRVVKHFCVCVCVCVFVFV